MLSCNSPRGIERRRRTQSGLTLVELIVAFSILLILTSMAVPLARYQIRRTSARKALRADLVDMRKAIDRYKDMCDQGKVQAGDADAYCYPASLQVMVDGVKLTNTISGNGQRSGKFKFLRRFRKTPLPATPIGVNAACRTTRPQIPGADRMFLTCIRRRWTRRRWEAVFGMVRRAMSRRES